MSDIFQAIREQVRHVSSLRCGYGTQDAIQSMDELIEMVQQQLAAANERADKAEARIKEADKQEPVGYADLDSKGCVIAFTTGKFTPVPKTWYPLYAMPPIPPDVAALIAEAREQGRKEAVPEGWQVVKSEYTEEELLYLLQRVDSNAVRLPPGIKDLWKAMLQSSPKVKP